MILGFVIDEHGNLTTGQEIDQSLETIRKMVDDLAPLYGQIAQACQQMGQALSDWGAAIVQAFVEVFGPIAAQWRLLTTEPDLEYVELAYRRYARWYNTRHRGRRVSWRRLNADQRFEAELRFA